MAFFTNRRRRRGRSSGLNIPSWLVGLGLIGAFMVFFDVRHGAGIGGGGPPVAHAAPMPFAPQPHHMAMRPPGQNLNTHHLRSNIPIPGIGYY